MYNFRKGNKITDIFTRYFKYTLMRSIIGVIACLSFLYTGLTQILAVDFGTEFIKSAVVNSGTGKSFSIVHNSKSDRKFINSIGFYNEERFYESQSLPKRGRFPVNCFIFNKLLADSLLDTTLPQRIKKDLLLEYINTEEENQLLAKFVLDRFPEDLKEVDLIEVVAMILKYAKANAESQIKSPIKDVILTVPNYWNLKMRQFLVEAAEVADLYVLSLISQNTGAAINYALNQRTKNTTQTILLYNLGSNSLQMTIAQFRLVEQEKTKPVQSIFIKGDYGESYVGGLRFDHIIFSFFKEKYQKKYSKELSKRGQIKLFHQSNQIKQVLSANKEATLFVEGLDGIDYMQKISRKQFQELAASSFEKVVSHIKRFLFDNDLRPEDLDGIEMIGGSIRIPKIQSMVADIIGDQSKIGTHINGDQAMVLGAAFYGANSSKKFKVKGVHLYDGFNFQIRGVIRNLDDSIQEGDEGFIAKNVTIFKKKSRFGITKQVNFKCSSNIILDLYKEDESGLQLLRSTKFDSIQKVNETDFKVSLTLSLDPLQIVFIKSSQITYKKDEVQSYVEKVKKSKKIQESSEQKKQNQQNNEEKIEQTDQENVQQQAQQQQQAQDPAEREQNQSKEEEIQEFKIQQDSDSVNQTKTKKKKKKEAKDEYETVERNKTVTKKFQRELKKEEIFTFQTEEKQQEQRSKKMLRSYEEAEENRKKLAESKNKLESLIYQGRDKLENDEFLEFSQASEIEKISEALKEKSDWLDETISKDHTEYNSHYKSLNRPIERIEKRINQYHSRDIAKKKAIEGITEYRNLTNKIRQKKQWITEEQIDQLLAKIEDNEKRIDQIYKSMIGTEKNENASFQNKDFTRFVDNAKDEYFKVMAIQKPKNETKKEEKKEQQFDDQL